ncbi:hypothetical protein LTS08_004506 [Lithohypha guttulata]|nr:hypothetical protein LTS08_004506 [Lithohypha guttulata]
MSPNISYVMRFLVTSLLFASVLAVPDPGTIGFKFKKRLAAKSAPSTELSYPVIYKRQDDTINADITNFQILYMINITIGTPGQGIGLQLDTGSSDLWVAASDSDVCSLGYPFCSYYGSYDAANSSTFRNITDFGDFYISYVDGTAIQGIYFNDTINIEGTDITGATMALAESADRDIGIMGIGFTENESSNTINRDDPFTYPTVLDNMIAQGHINSRSYALWLDDLNDPASTGTILFGGLDIEKYEGSLVSLPIQPDTYSGSRTSFTVAWTGLNIDTGSSTSNNQIDFSPSSPLPVILDSGTTLTYLPDDIVEQIFTGLGVTTDPAIGNIVPCTIAANNYTFIYTFGGPNGAQIRVPLSELLLTLFDSRTGEPYVDPRTPNGPPLCQMGIDKAGANPLLFGDTFLRSAYVVYDLENYQIALAQTNFRATASEDGDEVTQISGSAGIPDVVSTASEATVAQTFTGIPLNTEGGGSATSVGFGAMTRQASFSLSTSGTVAPSAAAGGVMSTNSGGTATSSRTTVSGSRTSSASVSSTASSSQGAASSSAASAATVLRVAKGETQAYVSLCVLLVLLYASIGNTI